MSSGWFASRGANAEEQCGNGTLVVICLVQDHAAMAERFMDIVSNACGGDLRAYKRRVYRMVRCNHQDGGMVKVNFLLDVVYHLRFFQTELVPFETTCDEESWCMLCCEAAHFTRGATAEDCVIVVSRSQSACKTLVSYKQAHNITSRLQIVFDDCEDSDNASKEARILPAEKNAEVLPQADDANGERSDSALAEQTKTPVEESA